MTREPTGDRSLGYTGRVNPVERKGYLREKVVSIWDGIQTYEAGIEDRGGNTYKMPYLVR